MHLPIVDKRRSHKPKHCPSENCPRYLKPKNQTQLICSDPNCGTVTDLEGNPIGHLHLCTQRAT